MKVDAYQVITDRIIALLESGTIPWRKPWTGGQPPQNFISRRPYGGINAILLNCARFASPFWLTFNQVKALGASIRKGEKAHPVVFWKLLQFEDEPEEKKVRFLRYHSVFNIEQCNNLKVPTLPSTETPFVPIERCEQVVKQMPQAPEIIHGGTRAAYSPATDQVFMPNATSFEFPELYYNVLFHEMTHSVGHASRLARKEVMEPIHFGTDPYCREELVAEMGATFLSSHCGIETRTIENSAGYIQAWLERLTNDKKLIVYAAAQAQKACNFILNRPAKEEEAPRTQPKEYKVVALRDCPMPPNRLLCDTPERVVEYWNLHIATSPQFNPDAESFAVLLLTTRKQVKGHQLVGVGILDQVLTHCRETFRAAIVAAAHSVVLVHNHPSGDASPSDSDIRMTREFIRAGRLLKIEVVDHIVIAHDRHCSLREMGLMIV